MAKQEKLLAEAAEQAARNLIAKRNTVMHRQCENLKDEALKAMEHLGVVLQALGRLLASDAYPLRCKPPNMTLHRIATQ